MPDERFYLNADPEFWFNVNGMPAGIAEFPPGTAITIKGVADTTADPMGQWAGWYWQHAGGADETLWVPGPSPGAFPFCMPDVWPNHTEVLIAVCASSPDEWEPGTFPCNSFTPLPFWNLPSCDVGFEGTCVPGSDCITGLIVSFACGPQNQ